MAPSLTPALSSLLGQLEHDVCVVLLVHESAGDDAQALLRATGHAGRARTIVVDDALPLHIWARDMLVAGRGSNGPCLYPAARLDAGLAPLLAEAADAADLPLKLAPDVPDGGNVIIGNDGTVFVGSDDWNGGAVARLFPPDARLIEVGTRFDVPAEETLPAKIGGAGGHHLLHRNNRPGTRQPLFHIDLFLTPAGRDDAGHERVLVGDPGLAAQILDHRPLAHAMQPIFDDIAHSLGEAGFNVIRNPLPLVYCDRIEDRERDWYFASANNAVVQGGGGADAIVWLPAYGNGNWPALAATDAANADIWRGLGFEVRMVEGCGPLAENHGGLRCLTNVLRRAA
jgi:hypothetical protein